MAEHGPPSDRRRDLGVADHHRVLQHGRSGADFDAEPWERMTAPSASSDPSPRRAVPTTTAERAIWGRPPRTRGALAGPALMGGRTMVRRRREGEIVDVAVPPVLARFVGLDDRVVLRAKCAVACRCGELSQQPTWPHDMHIRRCTHWPPMQAVLAPLAARGDVGDLVEVTAGLAHAKFRGASWSAGMMPSRPAS